MWMMVPPTYANVDFGEPEGKPLPSAEELQTAINKVHKAIDSFKAAEDDLPILPGVSLGADSLAAAALGKLKKVTLKMKSDEEWMNARLKPLTRFLTSCGALGPDGKSSQPGSPKSPRSPRSPRSPQIKPAKTMPELPSPPTTARSRRKSAENCLSGQSLAALGECADLRKKMRDIRAMGPKLYLVRPDISTTAVTGEPSKDEDAVDSTDASSGSKDKFQNNLAPIITEQSRDAPEVDALDDSASPVDADQMETGTPLEILKKGSRSAKRTVEDIDKALDWLLFPGLLDDNLLMKHRKAALRGKIRAVGSLTKMFRN
eukprot:gnl/MRDRNA2_/MRDRNA2_18564_c0_seq1.p1 gnl/MRDRNA2_/MRDRNA2_18564_c0~~gnl/MRDRNA2_/MRDRNA2_18564_c0_seq1.p1  ORF type:complete len:317 (+),score=76.22 gnl/MRDRNA2_/MRDRNA2_18564_c0_seq1:73-1023(+)